MEIICYGICTENCGAYKDGECTLHAAKAEIDEPIIEAIY